MIKIENHNLQNLLLALEKQIKSLDRDKYEMSFGGIYYNDCFSGKPEFMVTDGRALYFGIIDNLGTILESELKKGTYYKIIKSNMDIYLEPLFDRELNYKKVYPADLEFGKIVSFIKEKDNVYFSKNLFDITILSVRPINTKYISNLPLGEYRFYYDKKESRPIVLISNTGYFEYHAIIAPMVKD